ncbi:MAG: DUF4360 domain-containing protein [Polyangiales bacterium]
MHCTPTRLALSSPRGVAAALWLASSLAYADVGSVAPDDGGPSLAQAAPARTAVVEVGSGVPVELDVEAQGTGCPAGTWSAALAPDGSRVVVSFSAFTISLDAGQEYVTSDCSLRLRLRSVVPLSHAVTGIAHQGHVSASSNITASHVSSVHIADAVGRAPISQVNTYLPPPVDRAYRADHLVSIQGWSPCEEARTYLLRTSMFLQKGRDSGVTARMSVARDAHTDGKLEVGLAWRACAPSTR